MVHRARRHLTYANVVSTLALFLVLSGGVVLAAAKIGSKDIARNAIKSKHIRDGQVTGADLAANAVDGSKVGDDSLTGADVKESTLSGLSSAPSGSAGGDLTGSYPNPQIAGDAIGAPEVSPDSLTGADLDESTLGLVPSADHANTADTAETANTANIASSAVNANAANFATMAGDANKLGGLPASSYNEGCDAGSLNGIAQVVGGATFSATFTTSGVNAYNCAPQSVEARRIGVGDYHVRFNGNGSTFAVGSVDSASNSGSGTDDFVSLTAVNDGGTTFDVNIRDADGGAEDATFTLVVP